MRILRLLSLALLVSLGLHTSPAATVTPGFLQLSLYTNITGTAVTDLTSDPRYPASPSEVRWIRSFNTREALPTDALENFGGRIEGFITPQESGDYTFFLRSSKASELWLGTDDTEASATVIAQELDAGDPFMEPDTGDLATSAPVTLTAGKRYFIMVLYKGSALGGNSTDEAQVAWRKAGDPTPAASLRPIPGAFLSSAGTNLPPITILQAPKDITVEENTRTTFSAAATFSNTNYTSVQWERNGVAIPGAVGTNFTTFVNASDNRASFRAVFAMPGYVVISPDATVTVTADATAPRLLSAKGGPNRPEVTLGFSERLGPSATNAANYKITAPGGASLAVTEATLSADRTQVLLLTDTQKPGTNYTVTVNNVADLAAAGPKPVAPNSTASFYALGPLLQGLDGFVVWEAEDFDRNLDGLWTKDFERGVPSGGFSMVNYNGAGGNENSTKLEYDIIITKTGTNILWMRGSGNDGNDDSVFVHLDGARPAERAGGNLAGLGVSGSSLQSTYAWGTGPVEGGGQFTFVIDQPGLHTISIARREDGSFVDKLLITTDPAFNPTTAFGTFGPPVTLRQGEPVPAGAAISITRNPTNTVAVENGSVTLTAGAAVPAGSLFSFQWQRKQGADFVDIPRANATNLTINPVTMDWNGAIVRMRAIAGGDIKYTDEAVLTVAPDTTLPQVVRATGQAAANEVVLIFSEPITPGSAQTLSNYRIDSPAGGLQVTSATALPNGRTVVLQTAPQTAGTKYTVTVNGVADTARTPNLVVNGQARFYSMGALQQQGADGLLVFEAENFDRNLDGLWIVDRTRGTPSAGASVVLPNGAGGTEAASQLEYDLTFVKTGTHILWYRASGNDGNDDSAFVWIDGARPPNRTSGNQAGITGFGTQSDFVWRSQPAEGTGRFTFDIATAARHVLSLARREDGSFFDKFAITTDPNFNPADYGTFGPPETRAGVPALPVISITSPPTNSVFNIGSPVSFTVDISQTTRTVSKVEYFSGTTKLGESTTAPYSFQWTPAASGTNNVFARLTDDVNDVAQSRTAAVIVAAPPASILVSAALGVNELALSWTGGTPPFTVQKKTKLTDAAWTDLLTTTNSATTVQAQGSSAFFRISGQ